MNPPPPNPVDQSFLDARSRLIDIAAWLDRVERAQIPPDYRTRQFLRALEEVGKEGADRARRVLLAFSDPTTEPIESAGTQGATGAWPDAPEEVS